jgi:hypothetical protein
MMDRRKIISKIRIKLDEILTDSSSQIIQDPTIDIVLDETVTELLLMVPRYLIKAKPLATPGPGSGIAKTDTTVGYVVLPDDYLRLYSFKMTEWLRPVTQAISEDHPDFIHQQNTATRGKKAKPVCVLRYDQDEEAFVLDYYSVDTAHTIEYGLYIPVTIAEELQDNLIDPLTWLVVAKVLQIYSDNDQGQQKAMQQVVNWITINTK